MLILNAGGLQIHLNLRVPFNKPHHIFQYSQMLICCSSGFAIPMN